MVDDDQTLTELSRFEEDFPELDSTIELFKKFFDDSFMDVLAFYIHWRNEGKKPNSFLNRQLKDWGIQSWIGEQSTSTLKRMIDSGGITFQINDEATISAALSQQIFDRKIVTADRKKALICIARQESDIVLDHLGYTDIEQARKLFLDLHKVIEAKLN